MQAPPQAKNLDPLIQDLTARIDVPIEGRERIDVSAPFDMSLVGSVPQATPEDVTAAARRARAAQKRWQAVPPQARAKLLFRFHDLLLDHVDELVDLIQLEGGKARLDAWNEVLDVVGCSRYFANMTPKVIRRHRHQGAMPVFTKTYEYRHPKGVIGFISPWNYPFTLAISDALGALVSGNAVIIKPDEKTPYSALYGARLLQMAGFPRDLVQVVTGRGEPIGPSLVSAVDYIMFTGSTAVGRQIAEMAGRNLIGASMELGGKNAAIVMPDADLDRTVRDLATGCYANGGQTCVSMERVYVHESIHHEFVERFAEFSSGLPLSADYAYTSELSSLIDQDQLDRVHAHVEDAVAKGAEVLTGGKPRPDIGPYFYAPTVLVGVTPQMEVYRHETFGPVVSIYPYTDLEEAVSSANDSEFGLHYSVWTRDTEAALELSQRLVAGTVTINDGLIATWASHEAPMGGTKASGLGRRHGLEGILKFTEPQSVAVQRLVPAYKPFAGIPTERYTKLIEFLTRVFKALPFYR